MTSEELTPNLHIDGTSTTEGADEDSPFLVGCSGPLDPGVTAPYYVFDETSQR